MAANLLQVTVLEYGAQEPIQDTFQNIWLINKNRCLKAQITGSTDTLISYAERYDQQAYIIPMTVNDTYATISTGIITNGYTCGRKAEFTVLSYNGDTSGYTPAGALRILSIDNIIRVTKDLTDPTANSILWYLDPASMNPVPVKVLGDLAAIVTATTI